MTLKLSSPQVIWDDLAKQAAVLVKGHDLPSPAERPRRKFGLIFTSNNEDKV